MHKKKILIADDHALVREGIAAFLRLCDDVEVIAEASDGIEAIEKTNKYLPDIIIMDINMPKLGGLETTIEIKRMHPDIKVLVLTQYEDREYISRFLKAGVSGYLLKKAVGSDLITALKAIGRGELYLYSSIASEVVAGYLQGERTNRCGKPLRETERPRKAGAEARRRGIHAQGGRRHAVISASKPSSPIKRTSAKSSTSIPAQA